jgi:hypothetical protein
MEVSGQFHDLDDLSPPQETEFPVFLEKSSAFFVIESTRTVFQHLFSKDFESFNPIESFDVQGSSRDFGI